MWLHTTILTLLFFLISLGLGLFFNLNPGVIDTDMQSNIRRSEFPGVSDFITLKDDGKLKSPEMVAKSLVWMIDRAG